MTDSFTQNRAEGDAKTLTGSVKSAIGGAIGDDSMKAEGETQRLGGKVQSAMAILPAASPIRPRPMSTRPRLLPSSVPSPPPRSRA